MGKIEEYSEGEATVWVHHELNAAFVSGIDYKQAKRPTAAVEKTTGSKPYQDWGDNNDYPDKIYEVCKKNTIIPTVIDFKNRTLRAGRLLHGYEDIVNGKLVFVPVLHPDVVAFSERNDLHQYQEEILNDLFWWSHGYAELILSNKRDEILGVCVQDAMFVRLAKQNAQAFSPAVYLDANWPDGKEESWKIVPTIDSYFDPVNRLRDSKGYNYIYPITINSPGEVYYMRPSWHSIFDSGWLQIASSIPALKKAIIANQVTIRYHIEVADTWWKWKYKNWESMKPEERKNIQAEEFGNFTKFLSTEQSGKTLMTTFKSDPVTGKEYAGWRITAVDDKFKDGMYMEESAEASSHTLFALGVDGTLIGNTPGKGMGAGSGSDKKVAMNIFIITHNPYQEKILKPLNFIAQYNGWKQGDKQIKFMNENFLIATQEQEAAVKPANTN